MFYWVMLESVSSSQSYLLRVLGEKIPLTEKANIQAMNDDCFLFFIILADTVQH